MIWDPNNLISCPKRIRFEPIILIASMSLLTSCNQPEWSSCWSAPRRRWWRFKSMISTQNEEEEGPLFRDGLLLNWNGESNGSFTSVPAVRWMTNINSPAVTLSLLSSDMFPFPAPPWWEVWAVWNSCCRVLIDRRWWPPQKKESDYFVCINIKKFYTRAVGRYTQ